MKRKHATHILGFAFVMLLWTLYRSVYGTSNPPRPLVMRTHFYEIIWGSEHIQGAGTRYEIGSPLTFLIIDVGSTEKAKGKMIGETDSDRDRRDIKTRRFLLDPVKLLYAVLVVGSAYYSIVLLLCQFLKGLRRIKRGH